jgi:hypothetical protein
VQTYADAQPALRDGLKRTSRFLGLIALVSLILGGIGVAQTVRAWLASRFDPIAILKCLGVRPHEVVLLYAAETALLGLAGSLAGVAIATAILALAPRLLAGILPAVPIDAWQPLAALRGLGLGTGVALLFSVAPLSALRLVPPLRVLRRDAEPLASGLFARAVVATALLAGVFGAAYVQSRSIRIAAGFTAGMIAAAAILAGAARLLTRVVARVARERVRVAFRHGLSALARPGAGTLPAVTALGLGVMVVVAIALVHLGVMSKLRADLPKNAPNVFLVDMQSNQWPAVRAILEASGATEIRGVPIVNARLQSIDGVLATDLAKKGRDEGRRKWILTREQNLTYLDELPKDNVVVEGKLWSDPEHPEISIERDFAKDMGVKVGSTVVYDVQGVPLELKVTSLRTVDWKSFGINFFLVVEPGVLDKAPQMRVAAARLPAGREQALQDRLAAEVPNVTMLKVREIVEKVARLLERLGLAIRILGGFAIASGIAARPRGRAAEDARRNPPWRRRDLRRRVRIDRPDRRPHRHRRWRRVCVDCPDARHGDRMGLAAGRSRRGAARDRGAVCARRNRGECRRLETQADRGAEGGVGKGDTPLFLSNSEVVEREAVNVVGSGCSTGDCERQYRVHEEVSRAGEAKPWEMRLPLKRPLVRLGAILSGLLFVVGCWNHQHGIATSTLLTGKLYNAGVNVFRTTCGENPFCALLVYALVFAIHLAAGVLIGFVLSIVVGAFRSTK